MERAFEAVKNLPNNHTVVNTLLMCCFGALCLRSHNQENQIKALEAEKESIVRTNKTIKKTIWDWKQHLLSQAEAPNAQLPISKIRAIYGDTTPSASAVLTGGGVQKGVEKPQAPRLLI